MPRLQVISLLCLATATRVAGQTNGTVQLSSGALSFGRQVVGAVTAPQVETVTVQSTSAAGITFGNIAITGPNAADFLALSDTCSGKNISIGFCQIAIVFHPSAAGGRDAAVSVTDNASGSPQKFALAGTGVPVTLTSVEITPADPRLVSGSQLQLAAQGIYNDGTSKDLTKTASWESSDNRVATVKQGLAAGVRAGRVAITAALGDVQGRTALIVDYEISFRIQPGTTPVSKAISPGVKVQVRDNGSPVEILPVTIDLGPNPPNPAELSGDRTRTTGEDGTVTFTDLKLDYLGNGYTLVASALGPGGRSTAISAPFNETRVGDPCLGPNPACSSGCADSDGDGLNDAWEIAGGIDMNGDGRIDDQYDVMLPGADPNKPDVYVKYDYLVAPTHTHKPPPAAIQQVVQAYEAHGIALHIDPVHDAIPEVQVTTLDPAPTLACAGPSFVTMQTLRQQYFGNRKWAYHYGVFAHNSTLPDTAADGSSCPVDPECLGHPDPTGTGRAEVPGSSFIVSLGYLFDSGLPVGIESLAGTFMHELGHNFGLKHGSLAAPAPQTCLLNKPNYISVMDYSYQSGIPVGTKPGSTSFVSCNVDTDCPSGSHCTDDLGGAGGGNVCYRVDYSREKLLDLNESALNETLGVGSSAGDTDIVVYCGAGVGCSLTGPSHGPIDWNNDGNATETNVAADIENNGGEPALLTANDWEIANGFFQNLNFKFQCTTAFASDSGEAGVLGQVQTSVSTTELGLKHAQEHHILYPPATVSLMPNLACSNPSVAAAPPGILQIAVLGSPRLDVNQVELSSLTFHGARPTNISVQDVNNDGISDLLVQFRGSEVRLAPNATRFRLTGWLKNSRTFVGEAEWSNVCPQ